MDQKLRTKIKPYVKYVWMMRATRPAIPATRQPIFNESMGLSEVLEETIKTQMNLSVSMTKTGQLIVTVCLRRVHYLSNLVEISLISTILLSFNSPREHRLLQKQFQDWMLRTCGLATLKKTNTFQIYRDIYGASVMITTYEVL